MVYFKKYGNEKIVHVGWCTHVRRMARGTVGKFRTVAEAEAHGYRVCQCCAPEMHKYGMLVSHAVKTAVRKTEPIVSAFSVSDGEQLRLAI